MGSFYGLWLYAARSGDWNTIEAHYPQITGAAKGFVPPDNGARRELHTFHEPRGWDRYWQMWGSKKPTMGSFYGLWLFAARSGDWNTIEAHYPQITGLYTRKAGQCDLY